MPRKVKKKKTKKAKTNSVVVPKNSKVWSVLYMLDDEAEITEPTTLKKAKETYETVSAVAEGARIVCFPLDRHLKD